MKSQHIHHTNGGQAGSIEIGALSHACTHEKSTVAASLNSKLRAHGVLVRNQPLGCGNKVIEDVLFFELCTGLVPLLTILAPAPQIWDRKDAPISNHAMRAIEKLGVSETENPP